MHCLPPTGGTSAGMLPVTDRRILFEPSTLKQDFSLATASHACRFGGVVAGRFSNCWDGKSLGIPDADGQESAFGIGFLSVDKLVATLGG